MIREFFYLQKSDRRVVLALLVVIVLALGILFLTGEATDETSALLPEDSVADTVAMYSRPAYRQRSQRPTAYQRPSYYDRRPYYRRDTVRRDYYRRPSADGDSQPPLHHYPMKIREGEHVVLNTADTTVLQTVPGIGPYFARRIVGYRERLGGYVSLSQLSEIENFPDGALAYLLVGDTAATRRINLNRLTLNELKRHPYISFYQARAITDYRRLHGPLKSIDDLRLSEDFPPEAIERLRPYVEF